MGLCASAPQSPMLYFRQRAEDDGYGGAALQYYAMEQGKAATTLALPLTATATANVPGGGAVPAEFASYYIDLGKAVTASKKPKGEHEDVETFYATPDVVVFDREPSSTPSGAAQERQEKEAKALLSSSGIATLSAPDPELERGVPEWNRAFQELYERVENSAFGMKQRQEAMSGLLERFRQHALKLVRVLVEETEADVPLEQRRVPAAASLGGLAGGRKFICAGILLKFATDEHGIYGSEELAQKAAGLEIAALNAVIDSGVQLLHTTLTAVIRMRGHCVVATALAPIKGSETLVMGSADGGRTVRDNSPSMRVLIARFAGALRLKEHSVVETSSGRSFRLHVGADVEGHIGTDGRFYLVDAARLLPPVPPRAVLGQGQKKGILESFLYRRRRRGDPQLRQLELEGRGAGFYDVLLSKRYDSTQLVYGCDFKYAREPSDLADDAANGAAFTQADFLTRLFRPEFMCRHSPLPLSSDAFSRFAGASAEALQNNRDVLHVYAYLMSRTASSPVSELFDEVNNLPLQLSDCTHFAESFHKHGLNMRYLPLVWHHAISSTYEEFRQSLLHDMVARTIKCIFRERLRCIRGASNATTSQNRLAMVSFEALRLLRLAFGGGSAGPSFWSRLLMPRMVRKYSEHWSAELHEALASLEERAAKFGRHVKAASTDELKASGAGALGDRHERQDACVWLLLRMCREMGLALSTSEQHERSADDSKDELLSLSDALVWLHDGLCLPLQQHLRLSFNSAPIVAPKVKMVRVHRFSSLNQSWDLLNRELDMRRRALGSEHPALCTTLVALLRLAQTFVPVQTAVYEEDYRETSGLVYSIQQIWRSNRKSHMAQWALLECADYMNYVCSMREALDMLQDLLQYAQQEVQLQAQQPQPVQNSEEGGGEWNMHEYILLVQERIANTYGFMGSTTEQKRMLDEILRDKTQRLGRENFSTMLTLANLSSCLAMLGDYPGHRDALEEVLRVETRLYAHQTDDGSASGHSSAEPDHPKLALTRAVLSNAYGRLGEYELQLDTLQRALESSLRAHGDMASMNPDVALIENNLGCALLNLGRLDEALEHLEHAKSIVHSTHGDEHPVAATVLTNLCAALRGRPERVEERIANLELACRIKRDSYGPKARGLAVSLINLSIAYMDRGRGRADREEALKSLTRAGQNKREMFSENHPALIYYHANMAFQTEYQGAPLLSTDERRGMVLPPPPESSHFDAALRLATTCPGFSDSHPHAALLRRWNAEGRPEGWVLHEPNYLDASLDEVQVSFGARDRQYRPRMMLMQAGLI